MKKPYKHKKIDNVVQIETKRQIKQDSEKTKLRNKIVAKFIAHSKGLDW